MSRSNKNNRKKIRLSTDGGNEHGQPLRCSSSSGSSNYSDDMDAIRNAVLESLMKTSTVASKSTTTTSTTTQTPPYEYDAVPTRHQQQQPPPQRRHRQHDIDNENAVTTRSRRVDADERELALEPISAPGAPPTPRARDSDDEKIRTDVKIVRIKTLDSEESKLLLIVDVLDRNPFRIEVQSDAKRDQDGGKCIKVDMEALKRGECPKEIRNLCTKVRSRRIYKLPDELMRKFDQKGLKVFEWHSFNRPDEVIKLLLQDDGGGGGSGTAESAAAAADVRKRMIIGFRRRSTAAVGHDEPVVKIRRTQASSTNSGTVEMKMLSRGIRKARLAAEQRGRNRMLQRLLKEYNMSYVWDANQKINRLVRSHLDHRAKDLASARKTNEAVAATQSIASVGNRECWKSAKHLAEFTASLKRDVIVEAAKVSLNDDNDVSVSNSNADVSAIDGNSDALNNSNNDDNDSKAKKKNRCALCRKKVGLTGFECRCGGLYCGIHRYSDKHNCTFDYRQLGAQEIRRNNPVVIGEKIQKI